MVTKANSGLDKLSWTTILVFLFLLTHTKINPELKHAQIFHARHYDWYSHKIHTCISKFTLRSQNKKYSRSKFAYVQIYFALCQTKSCTYANVINYVCIGVHMPKDLV